MHRDLCSMLCGSLDGRGFGGEWIHGYVWLSAFTVHVILSQYCKSAMLQYKIKSCKKEKVPLGRLSKSLLRCSHRSQCLARSGAPGVLDLEPAPHPGLNSPCHLPAG